MKPRAELERLYMSGIGYIKAENFSLAYDLFREIVRETNDAEILGKTYAQLCFVALNEDNFADAIEYGKKCERFLAPLVEENKRYLDQQLPLMLADNYRFIGLAYFRGNEDEDARRYFEKSLAVATRFGLMVAAVKNFDYLAKIFLRDGELEDAENLMKKSIKISEEEGIEDGLKYRYADLANLYSGQNRDLKKPEMSRLAIKMFLKEIAVLNKKKDYRGLAYAHGNLAREYTRVENSSRENFVYNLSMSVANFKRAVETLANKDVLLRDLAKQYDFLAFKIFQTQTVPNKKYIEGYIKRAKKYIESCAENGTPIEPEIEMQIELLAMLSKEPDEAVILIRYEAIKSYKDWFERVQYEPRLTSREVKELIMLEKLCFFLRKDKEKVRKYLGEEEYFEIKDLHVRVREYGRDKGITFP